MFAGAYDRFMGRFSQPLAHEPVGPLDLRPGMRAPGVGTQAMQARFRGDDTRSATAEGLPFEVAGSAWCVAAQV